MAQLDENATLPPETTLARARADAQPRGTHAPQDNVPAAAVSRADPARVDAAMEHARICARIAEDNRARDILLLDLRDATALVDFFVIATATSRRQGNAIAIEVDQEMKRIGEHKLGIEGSEEGRWTLIDYGDFVVHVFSEEARAYYALEEIWGDAPQLDWRESASVPTSPDPAADGDPGMRDPEA